MKNILLVVACVTMMIAGSVFADKAEQAALDLLKGAGADRYAVNAEIGGGIDALYLGYREAQKEPVAGAAVRKTKTYRKITAVALVEREGEGFKLSGVEVPDIKVLPGKSRDYVMTALEDIKDRTFTDEQDTRGMVDAVSGATTYYKAIYISYSLMSSKVIEQIKEQPDWPQQPIAD